MSTKGVVAAGHESTVRAAEIILQDGGNAFDAILAAHFAACAAEPVLASLGGGGFMIATPENGEPVVYDFFVQTPRRKQPIDQLEFRPIVADFGTAQQQFHIGHGTIATPGCVKGIFKIHRELGSLPLQQIAAPAIQFAREGVTVTPTQAYIFQVVSPIYLARSDTREIFCGGKSRDRVLAEGETLRQTLLADTIEQLATEGEDVFYGGDIGQRIVAQCRDEGGHLTIDDLRGYEVVKRKPLSIEYGGARVMTNPPPSSAGTLIGFALELLKALDLPHDGVAKYPYLRILAEVMDLTNKARVDRMAEAEGPTNLLSLLDPRLLDVYKTQVIGRAQAIRGTTHISVIDCNNNVASMTLSNGEGSGAMVSLTGIMLNNMLGEEDLNYGGFHEWAEDQRMTSMMAPSIIHIRNDTSIAMGSGGSNRIRTALLQVIMNLLHFGMGVTEAVESPRIHLEDDKLSIEGGFSSIDVERLTANFPTHEIWAEHNLFFGGVHTVLTANGKFLGAGDMRRGGICRVVT